MKLTFLSSTMPLSKRFTLTTKEPYPNAYEFTSHIEYASGSKEVFDMLVKHAALGHCLLKGSLDRDLVSESRAGHTSPDEPTELLCLDIDHLPSLKGIPQFMAEMGMPDVSHVVQMSASYGIHGNLEIRAHVFVLTTTPVRPSAAKLYLKHKNLTTFRDDLSLTKTHAAIRWALDITTCQNDKLIFITPPICDPASINHFTGERIYHVQGATERFDFDKAMANVPVPDLLRAAEQVVINELRTSASLPPKTQTAFKTKTLNGQVYQPNPGEALVSSTKSERGFTYFNLNGGDSWGYYHPDDNPEFIHNFKDEPVYRTSELLPDYWKGLSSAKVAKRRAAAAGKLFLAFRDRRTDKYFNGWIEKDVLTLDQTSSERKVEDFLTGYGQPIPEAIPIWNVIYDPGKPLIDLNLKEINTFQPSEYMLKTSTPSNHKPKPTPLIDRLITHVVGADMADYWFNWFAYVFQYKTAPKTSWIQHGAEGTGKGVLFNKVIARLLGMSNVVMKRMEELESQFNGHLEHTLFCFIDEVQISESLRNKVIMANLKNQITEPWISIRRMHTNSYMVKNLVAYTFASNMPDPVVIGVTDRRFNVGHYQSIPLLKVMTVQEIDQIENELDDFAWRLAQHKVDLDAVINVKHTAAKTQMVQVSRTSADMVADALKAGQLSVLVDMLPDLNTPSVGEHRGMLIQNYTKLIEDLIMTGRASVSREELQIIFTYNVGQVPESPYKFTTYMKHHGLEVKKVRIGSTTTTGMTVKWQEDAEWFAQQKDEIQAARTALTSPGKPPKAQPQGQLQEVPDSGLDALLLKRKTKPKT